MAGRTAAIAITGDDALSGQVSAHLMDRFDRTLRVEAGAPLEASLDVPDHLLCERLRLPADASVGALVSVGCLPSKDPFDTALRGAVRGVYQPLQLALRLMRGQGAPLSCVHVADLRASAESSLLAATWDGAFRQLIRVGAREGVDLHPAFRANGLAIVGDAAEWPASERRPDGALADALDYLLTDASSYVTAATLEIRLG